MMLVRYGEDGYTFYASVDLSEWEGQLGEWDHWRKENGWAPASPAEKLRSAMVEPVYRVRTLYEGRQITMWAVK